jgi:hypothetical protein
MYGIFCMSYESPQSAIIALLDRVSIIYINIGIRPYSSSSSSINQVDYAYPKLTDRLPHVTSYATCKTLIGRWSVWKL